MRLFRPLFLTIALLISLLGGGAHAQSCAATGAVFDRLKEAYGELPIFFGVTPDGAQMVITAAPDGAGWSLVGVTPDGQACLMGVGDSHAIIDPPPPGEKG